ncbi:MAG: GAF domain-containing protein [Nitrospirae bacterium]|nr:GAF domain-containing protein [Nitrospirota bacterium]
MSSEEKDIKEADLFKKVEEFLQVFKKGEEFTHELLKENERLRFKIVRLEEDLRNNRKQGDNSQVKLLKDAIAQLEEERNYLTNKFKVVESENKDFAARYVEVEEENNNLANLYVASYQLHSTLDIHEVLTIVVEIIINLIGAEKFSLMLLDEDINELVAAASEGIDKSDLANIKIGEGIIGDVAKTGESYFEKDLEKKRDELNEPLVCIPLMIKEHVIGVLVIYSLLIQKKGFNRVDYELFSMLAGHAATAIFSSRLYAQSERKLSTIQGFIELLSGKPKPK